MKSIVLSLFFVLLVFGLCAETIVPGGNISGVWTAAGSPYRIMGNVTVQTQDMLVLEAGTLVQYEGTYQMQVLGKIFSNGTADDVVTFTATDTLNGWSSIRFSNNSTLPAPHSGFSYTHFFYGRAVHGTSGQDPLNFGGAIWANNAGDLFFENCLFSRCKSAQDGSAIYAQENSNVMMVNCTISNCESGFFGGVFVKNSSANIENCTFKNNYAQTFGAALYFYQCPVAKVTSSSVSNNTAGAVAGIYSYASPLKVVNSLFKGNSTITGLGGGIGIISGTLTVTNCTFADNSSPQGGGAIWMNIITAPANLTNNIFWNNTPLALTASSSQYNLSHCSLQTAEGDATNIVGDPLFTNPADGDYTLSELSPCIDAGTADITGLELPLTDLAGMPRIVDGNSDSIERIDIGCYEWQVPVQLGTITGSVTDGQGQPLAGVAVTAGGYITVTDAAGNYTFILAPGTYTMTATLTGYYTQTVEGVEVTANQTTFMYFVLDPVSASDPVIASPVLNLLNSPNPFMNQTEISFNLSKAGTLRLEIYNTKGQKVKTLLMADLKAGSHSISWNGTNDSGDLVSSGIYLMQMEFGNQIQHRKLMKF